MGVWQRGLDAFARINTRAYQLAAICLLLMVITSAALVIVRYGLGLSSIAVQEGIMYLHAIVLSLGLAGAWQADGHVRIDIFYRRWDARQRQRLNRFGVVLLAVPFAVFVCWSCLEYVQLAWQRQESSPEPGGLPWLWALKTLLLVFPVQLLLAALWVGWKAPQTQADEGGNR